MALMHHDTTGTQTDCPRPLSRKKLKQLMPQSSMSLTSRAMFARTGRLNTKIRRELAEAERKRKAERELSASDSKATYKLIEQESVGEKKPNLLKKLSGFFGNLQRRAERESARKGA
jgi:hypothetical protein